MSRFSVLTLATAALLASVSVNAEKQIKLEDIEKDNLKAAQQAKFEKQLQQYQQYQQYQQQAVPYDPQAYSQQPAVQAYPGAYSQYVLPQQYIQQPLYTGGYTALGSNGLGQGYTAQAVHPFQAYIGQQLAAGVPASHQPVGAHTQSQPIVMAISAPALAAFQQQAYYQAVLPKMLSGLQYVPQGSQQLYYTSQSTGQEQQAAQPHPGVVFAPQQQYVPSFNPLPPTSGSTKLSAAYSPSPYISTAPQTFPSAYSQGSYSPIYPSPTPYTQSQAYASQDSPPFVSVKAAPAHLLSSAQLQHQHQYLQQPQPTTISPLQTKYLNSPQFLAQNYNTIQSSQLAPKASFPVGIKSTVSPPLKIASTGGYLSSNPSQAVQGVSYPAYRGLSG